MLPAIIAAVAPLIPSLIGLFDDEAEKVAERFVPAVQALTGQTEPAAVAASLKADPMMLLQAQKLAADTLLSLEREETERLRTVNETIRAEAASSDPFVRRMRPFFGYIMALTWGGLMGAVSYIIVTAPGQAAAVLSGIAETTMLWGIGLAVLGVYVWKRSEEKGAGGSPLDLIPLPGRKPGR